MYVITYYTEGTRYEEDVKNLEASLNRFGIPYHKRGILDRGSWKQNVFQKPKYILEMLESMNRGLVWLDADAVVNSYPVIFDQLTEDFAAHCRKDGKRNYQQGIQSGTMFFNNTDEAKELLEKWIKNQEHNPDKHIQPQSHLQEAFNSLNHKLRFKDLPQSYTKIFDNMDGEAVIEHFQSSRFRPQKT